MMNQTKLLVDTSFLVALYHVNAKETEAVRAIARLYRSELIVPQIILTEVFYLIKRDSGVWQSAILLKAFAESYPSLIDVSIIDLQRASEIMQQYASANFDFVDCCLMALAERLEITQIATLDHRDFRIFRPKHCEFLELFP